MRTPIRINNVPRQNASRLFSLWCRHVVMGVPL